MSDYPNLSELLSNDKERVGELEAENAMLREALERLINATIANLSAAYAMREVDIARAALTTPASDWLKGQRREAAVGAWREAEQWALQCHERIGSDCTAAYNTALNIKTRIQAIEAGEVEV